MNCHSVHPIVPFSSFSVKEVSGGVLHVLKKLKTVSRKLQGFFKSGLKVLKRKFQECSMQVSRLF